MSIRTPTKSSWPRKLVLTLLLVPLAIMVITKNPGAVGSGVANLISAGATFLNWCADGISALIKALAA